MDIHSFYTSRFLTIFICTMSMIVNGALAEDRSIRIPIVLQKENKSRDSLLTTRTISTADLSVRTSELTKYSARPIVTIGSERTLIYVGVSSFKKRTLFKGLVKVSPSTKKLTPLKVIKVKKKRARALHNYTIGTPAAPIPPSVARVALRDSDFTITGPRTSSWMALAATDVIGTSMAAADCYRKDDGFYLMETSSEFWRARAEEIRLCRSGLVDKSTCFDPGVYQPPNTSVKGAIVFDGSTISIGLSFFDESGSEAATSLITGPLDSFINLLELSGSDIGAKICELRGLKVTLEAVNPHNENCSYSDFGRCGCSEIGPAQGYYWEGGIYSGEMKGPLGTVMELAHSSKQMFHSTISCGGWSKISCSTSLCCKRESLSQPVRTNYEANLSFPPYESRCLCDAEEFTTTLTAKTAIGSSSKSQELSVRCITG